MISILIVDDERIERNGIELLIRRLGLPMEPTQAENGEAALRLLEQRRYDLLLTDIKMPFMDGLALAHRARELYPELVVLIFSAYSDFEKAQRAIQEQVYRYLLKPVDIGEFRAVMQACIDDIERQRTGREAQDQLARKLDSYRRKEAMLRSCATEPLSDSQFRQRVEAMLSADDEAALTADNPAVLKALALIRENYMSDISLEDMARETCLAPGYFSTLFKQQTGVSFVKYLNNYRMDLAARMLCQTNRRVNEIAADVGVPGESHFIALFKQRFGMTPRTFRMKMGGQP